MANSKDFDGFYAIYYHGAAGPGLAQIQLNEGSIMGADVTGGKWDGKFAIDPVARLIRCAISIHLPAGVSLATTGSPPTGNEATDMHLELPFDFAEREFLPLELPIGKINVRFAKLR